MEGEERHTCSGVYTEWGFEQMITMFRDFRINTGIRILKDNILSRPMESGLSDQLRG